MGTISATDWSTLSFTRFTVRGGWYFYLDWIAVGNFVDPEPTVGIGSPEIGSCFPNIALVKSTVVSSDPINDGANPKAIPGASVLFCITVTNQGFGAADSNSVVTTDPIPANTGLYVEDINGPGSGPVLFADGAASSGLSYTFVDLASALDDVDFSDDNGVTYSYVPVPDGYGLDTNVTHIRVAPKGMFNGCSDGNNPSFELRFQVRIR
jgi:uncharacterized repeat protein (TIGR01451 family)